MGDKTGISWTDSTHNHWLGCTKVSPGCANCYAQVNRAVKIFGVEWGTGKPRRLASESTRNKPLAWNRAAAKDGVCRKVFCSSLSDWLDPEVPAEWLADLLELIASTPRLDWQLLSKRPELWQERLEAAAAFERSKPMSLHFGPASNWLAGNAPANVWVGTTVEDQRRADERVPALLAIPAKVRFLSMEPLLEAVDLESVYGALPEGAIDCNRGDDHRSGECGCAAGVDWVIVGGESGPNARPFDLAWARSIVKQCKEAGVAVFVKQMGDWTVADGNNVHGLKMLQLDPKNYGLRDDLVRVRFTAHHGAEPSEWPADLRVQEFPGG